MKCHDGTSLDGEPSLSEDEAKSSRFGSPRGLFSFPS